MKNVWMLIKKDYVNELGFLKNLGCALQVKAMRNQFIAYITMVVCIGVYSALAIAYGLNFFDIYVSLGYGEYFLGLTLVAHQMMTIILGLPSIMSNLYFNKDVQIMQRLPISMGTILMSKIVNYTCGFTVLFIITSMPLLIKYCGYVGKGFLLYIEIVAGSFLVTSITISLLVMLIAAPMRLGNRIPYLKNLFQALCLVFMLVFILGFQILISKMNDDNIGNEFVNMSKEGVQSMYFFLPQIKLLMVALTSDSIWVQLGLLFTLALLGLIVCYGSMKISSRLIISGLQSNLIHASRKKIRKSRGSESKIRSIRLNIAMKEVKEILTTPIYAYNILGSGIVIPIFILVPQIARGTLTWETGKNVGDLIETMGIGGLELAAFGGAIGFCLTMLLGCFGTSAMTSMSREGKRMWMMQTLPIEPKDQVEGRMICSYIFQMATVIPISIFAFVLIRPGLYALGGYLVGIIVGMMFVGRVALMLNILYPKVEWSSPQEATKGGLGNYIMFIGTLIYIGIQGFAVFNFLKIGWMSMDVFKILVVILLGVHIVGAFVIKKFMVKLYRGRIIGFGLD